MMQAMVDHVTGMVYWVPVADQSATAPLVMQSPFRLLRPVLPPPVPVPAPVVLPPVGVPLEPNTTVFVRGIPREATTQSVESFFHIYGEIVSCHVIRHKDASTNKGIAFVKFRDAGAAQRAISCNNPGVMEQREVFAEWAHPRSASSAPRALPDQPIGVGASGSSPHVYLSTPAPRFLPLGAAAAAAQPWIVGSPYLPTPAVGVGGHVLGFPAHAAFTGHENFAFSNYYPMADYAAAAAPGLTASAPRAGPSTRNECDVAVADESERESHDDDSHCSITRLHLGDSERSATSRKGKEKEKET